VNHSSYLAGYGRERYIGSHFGVYAKPLPGFIDNIKVVPGDTTATVTWTTLSPATTQVQYGLTPSLGSFTTLSSALVTNHVVTLTNLSLATAYYYQVMSSVGTTQYVSSNLLFTTLGQHRLFDLENSWTFSTANLDGVNWTAPAYDDSGWDGSGPGLLWADTSGSPNSAIPVPMVTQMPWDPSTGDPYPTYYLRTHFTLTNNMFVSSLLFSNYVDDGAVYYLNGTEVYRLRMPASPVQIVNSTLATGFACSNTVNSGNAACPDIFAVSGNLLTNLLTGDNVVAVEVHNYATASPDITFGLALDYIQPNVINPQLIVSMSNGSLVLSWSGGGFTLQQANSPAGPWADVPGPVTTSPFTNSISASNEFYRLRN
jgi:hypothetical protein